MKAFHNSWLKEYREPFGAAPVGSVVHIVLKIESELDPEVNLRTWHNAVGEIKYSMQHEGTIDNFKVYSVDLKLPNKPCLVWYYFTIKEGDTVYYYGNNAEKLGGIGQLQETEPESYQITVYKESACPSWYKDGIAYQIFPDRFARDDNWKMRTEFAIENRNRDIDHSVSQKQLVEYDWEKPAYYVKDDEGNVTEWPFYGGSLRGIEDHLDYLKSYGVSILYLNPIFKSVSNHRYDTADYMTVDPILGTDEDFRSLVEAADEKGISIILDGVFSHTGADSVYFDKYSNYGGTGAYNNPFSQYRYWYKFDENEENGYKSWWGVRDLPEVDENNAFYRQMICGENGVLMKWLKDGARGWRLDVADELPDSFIKDIRSSIKYEDKENVLLGEVWEDASNKVSYGEQREYLMGDELDSTMNYPLRQILLDYVNYTISSEEASRRIMNLKENYPKENFYGALNVLGTHDRARLLTLMAASEDYNAAASKVKLLATLQYTLPGIPCIYYGDEVGVVGGEDPENRGTFPWGHENKDIAYHYRMLGLIYREHPVLKQGEIELLTEISNDDVLAFVRYNDDEKILVVTNRSYCDTEIDLTNIVSGSKYALDLLSSCEIEPGVLKLDRLSSKIILLKDEIPSAEDVKREAGVICHISSLPGGILGQPARDFVDWLVEAGIRIWQILPLNPNGLGDCPYNSNAAFAGNPDFINYKELPDSAGFDRFCRNNEYWIKDYVEFMLSSNSKYQNLTEIEKKAIKITLLKEQYYFDCQWKELRKYANSKGIRIMGDLPMFVSADGADVAGNPELFLRDEDGRLSVNAGVPPDGFSDEGQNWGSALYDWDALKKSNYDWWIKRLKQCAERYDMLRLDHFRAFSEYYAIPVGKTPKDGTWQRGPGMEFFNAVNQAFRENGLELEIIAEDLGLLDAGVKNLIKLTGYPGMDIWQFSAEEMKNAIPEYAANRAYYSGTHDNQTLLGWILSKNPDLSLEEAMEQACDAITWIFNSPAKYAIVQLQDMFLLDDSARMNVPGVAEGNWKWKIPDSALSCSEEVATWYRELVISSNRI